MTHVDGFTDIRSVEVKDVAEVRVVQRRLRNWPLACLLRCQLLLQFLGVGGVLPLQHHAMASPYRGSVQHFLENTRTFTGNPPDFHRKLSVSPGFGPQKQRASIHEDSPG